MSKHRKWPTGEGKQIYKKQMNVIKHSGSNTLNFWGRFMHIPTFVSLKLKSPQFFHLYKRANVI